jgi:hypothetical protein
MVGANMFLMYQDGNGNVTVSSRQSSGHVQPQYDAATASDLELLSGSGVSGDVMVANVRCANCEVWSGGTLDVADTGSQWIGAWKGGASLASTDLSESISVHDETHHFNLDLTQASLDTDSDPFSGAGNTVPASGSGSSASGGSAQTPKSTPNKQVIWAHGIGMALIGKWYVHGGVQVVTWLLMWAAFGLGIFGAQQRNMVSSPSWRSKLE